MIKPIGAETVSGPISFNRDIRPILSDKCFHCHGPDEAERKGGLRLDMAEAAYKGGDSGPAIVPGNPNVGELLARVTTHDKDDLMPPPKSGKTVSEKEVALLRQWIQEGAVYQGHWAFLKPERIAPPAIGEPHPVDAFVMARLKELGLTPNPEASKETLIRRLSLDLTGLPPTPAEVDTFLADQSPQAYDTLVDRLLSSPRFGEHMAVGWLDQARFADSNGFQSDGSRDMWAWREWVIKAFNQNMPFDQFTIDQLAGDMLPQPTDDQIIATGFNRNHRLNGEGGRIEAEWFVETVIDRVETTGLTWMALTFNCCRCHDHKYDPISQKEFYQMFAIFNSVEESGVLAAEGKNGANTPPLFSVASPEQLLEKEKRQAALSQSEEALKQLQTKAAERLAAWETSLKQPNAPAKSQWAILEPGTIKSEGGATMTRQSDSSWLVSGTNPAHDVYVITAPIPAGTFSGLMLETLPDDSLPNKSLGRFSNGNFVLTSVEVTLATKTAPDKPKEIQFARAEATYSQESYDVANLLKKDGKPGWAINGPKRNDPTTAVFALKEAITVPNDTFIRIVLRHDSTFDSHNIGRFRLSTTGAAPQEVTLKSEGQMPPDITQILAIAPDKRQAKQKEMLAAYFQKEADTEWKTALAGVDSAKKSLADLSATMPTTMVMKERAAPKDAFVLFRGEYDKPKDKVERAVPAFLPPLPAGEPINRLSFARWLVSPEHPLTARVFVNRTWERFFGTGIVKTTENLGSQSDWPSHLELLDWLATEFMAPTTMPQVQGKPAQPWDIKGLMKLIVTSKSYRQSTVVTPEKLERDPENRLVSRGPRFRMTGEMLRDQALSVSGLLVEKIGGPSVRPYMPAGVWDETSKYGNLRGYKHDKDDGLHRRTLYTIWKRTAAPPTMLLFDAPNREVCQMKRSRTNTPLQALSTLNEITFVEAARHLAQRMIKEGGTTPAQRIAWGFRTVTARFPQSKESAILEAGFAKHLARYQSAPADAKALGGFGDAATDPSIDPTELAAYTLTANVLLNMDETIVRE